MADIALFASPIAGRIWDTSDSDVQVPVTIIGMSRNALDEPTAIIVDEDELCHEVRAHDVDFLGAVPK